MAIKDIVDVLIATHPLDRIPRAGFLLRGVTEPESVAAHSHSLALLTALVCEEDPGAFDAFKAVKMAILHDLQESQTMDIPLPVGTEKFKAVKAETEKIIFGEMFSHMPSSFETTYREFMERKSREARLVAGLDKVQMMIKVLCYEREGRGTLGDFWNNPINFRTYDLPVLEELFLCIARLAARKIPQ